MATILVVDDRPSNRQFLVTLLGYHGHRLLEASDGAEALAVARAERPDLVMTDILMPGMDGYMLARELRRAPQNARAAVVFLSAVYLEDEARELARACGVSQFLTKPVEPQAVLRAVAAALEAEPAPLTEGDSFYGKHLRLLNGKLYQKVQELEAANEALERRVAERTAELEGANRELEAFAYTVSHDLRAPLRAIDGFSGMLLDWPEADVSGEYRDYLRRVRESARQMDGLVTALLEFSRLARQPLARRRIDAKELVQSCLEELRPASEGRHIDLVVGELEPCDADPVLLKQVFMNLLGNAIKYSRGVDPARIEIGCEIAEGPTAYFVRDNGAGFDMRYAAKLFGVFQRLHGAHEFEGAGAGLAIARRIVERHGGRIWGQGAPGRGATFRFTLSGHG